jgi:hypothetical protein
MLLNLKAKETFLMGSCSKQGWGLAWEYWWLRQSLLEFDDWPERAGHHGMEGAM